MIGEAKRFLSVYDAYKTGKDVTTRRLYLERMDVLSKSEKVIVDKGQAVQVWCLTCRCELKKRSDGATQ